jgi:eukaryotic-like serine/threonine-protein kinase
VHYLHDNGIVHRDLKPANIFLENGVVKVGDYGLCKFIAGSQHQEQTQNIGTVHYMAPEISTGNYHRQVDIYAAGIILYEMLTGKVPFDGESAGEILMKHLTARPEWGAVPASFRPIMEKALHKNPLLRYTSMAELAKDVASLTALAEGRQRAVIAAALSAPSPGEPLASPPASNLAVTQVYAPRARLADLAGALLLALALALLLSMAWALVFERGDWHALAPAFFLSAACSSLLLIPGRLWTTIREDSWQRRLIFMSFGFAVGALAIWLEGYPLVEAGELGQLDFLAPVPRSHREVRDPVFNVLYPENHSLPVFACWLGYFGAMLLVLRWWKGMEADRRQRFSVPALLATCFWAYILLFLLPTAHERQIGFTTMTLTSIIVQLASPCKRPSPPREKRLRLKYA